MTEPVSTIRNLGPASEDAFARAGIHSADELRTIGADAAYERLILSGSAPHFIGYYALVMGLQGRPWNDCAGDEKRDLRKRFDQIKAKARKDRGALTDIERELDKIGVRPRP